MKYVWLVFVDEELASNETMSSVHSVHIGKGGAEEMVESLKRPTYGYSHVWWERWTIIQ